MFALVAVCLLSGYLFYRCDFFPIVKNYTLQQYDKYKRLKKFVASQYTGKIKIICITWELISKAMYLSFVQWLNNSVKQIDKNTYTVSYVIKGRYYTMLIKTRGGPSPILLAMDENGDDITDLVIPYLGPKNDFHGAEITPSYFEKKTLEIELSNGDNLLFLEDDILSLTK